MKRNGFTLAEVLITLGIIGVVAAMTIPTLISNTNSQKYRAQFKKTISTLNQAARMSIAQYDVDFAGVSATCSDSPATDTAEKEATICGIFNTTLAGATYIDNFFDNYSIDNNGENEIRVDGDVWYTYQLSDGSLFGVLQQEEPCAKDTPCLGFIDVNGKTLPNKQVHGQEVTAYNRMFDLPAYGDFAVPKKGCPEKYCPGGGHVDQTTCKCVGGTGDGGGISIGDGGGISIGGGIKVCKTACLAGYTQTKDCKCIATEPDPSPDPTYMVPGDANHTTDVYPIAIYDHTVVPASRAAWYVLSTTKSSGAAASSKKSKSSKGDGDTKILEPIKKKLQ